MEYAWHPEKDAHGNRMYLCSQKPPLAGTVKCLKFYPARELVSRMPTEDANSQVRDEAQFITHSRSGRRGGLDVTPLTMGRAEGRWSRWVCVVCGARSSRRLCSRGDSSLLPRTAGHMTALRRHCGQRRHLLCEEEVQKHRKSMERVLFRTTYVRNQYSFITPEVSACPLSVSARPQMFPLCGPVTADLCCQSPNTTEWNYSPASACFWLLLCDTLSIVAALFCHFIVVFGKRVPQFIYPRIANVHWIISTVEVINTVAKNVLARFWWTQRAFC